MSTPVKNTLDFSGGGAAVGLPLAVAAGQPVVFEQLVPVAISPLLARIYRSTNQSIPTGTGWTSLVWDTAAYQANGTFWTSGATTTVPETGYYQIFVEATFDGAGLLGAATTNMQLLVNGSVVAGDDEKQVIVNGKASLIVIAQRLFTAGDTFLVQVKHSDSGSLNVLSQGSPAHSPDIIFAKQNGAKGDAGAPGSGGSTTGEILFDFGVAPGSNVATTTVTQVAVAATSTIMIDVLGTDSTGTHNAYEHAIVHLGGTKCSPISRTVGVGFTAQMYSLTRLTGVFKARYSF